MHLRRHSPAHFRPALDRRRAVRHRHDAAPAQRVVADALHDHRRSGHGGGHRTQQPLGIVGQAAHRLRLPVVGAGGDYCGVAHAVVAEGLAQRAVGQAEPVGGGQHLVGQPAAGRAAVAGGVAVQGGLAHAGAAGGHHLGGQVAVAVVGPGPTRPGAAIRRDKAPQRVMPQRLVEAPAVLECRDDIGIVKVPSRPRTVHRRLRWLSAFCQTASNSSAVISASGSSSPGCSG